MSESGYQQYCALARALDAVGSRWTLLIVRELQPGPRRFTDLIDGLPGISRKLLTERLRDLERDGIITRKHLPPPAARQIYELTDEGHDLATAVAPLITWGRRRLGELQDTDVFQARWSAVGMATLADRDATKGVSETYQYVIGDLSFHFVVNDGSIEVHDGRAEDAAVVVEADEETWENIVSGKTTPSSAQTEGLLTITGDRQAAKRLQKIFSRTFILTGVRHSPV